MGDRALAIELFAGTMSWMAGWRELGGYSVGFDIEHLPHHGRVPIGAELVIQDVLTLHGSQFRNASLIVASPPCQKYSYLAMPWSRSKDPNNSKAAKALRKKWETNGPDNRLFDACFRIQREASEAAGRYIPLIVENVRGAQPWVGPAKANFGSFYLWGDIAQVGKRIVRADAGFGAAGLSGASRKNDGAFVKVPGVRFDGSGRSFQTASVESTGVKTVGHANIRDGHSHTRHLTNQAESDAVTGTKIGGDWFRDPACHSKHGSRSSARKAASAQIAMIPTALSRHIAEIFWPASILSERLPLAQASLDSEARSKGR